MYWLTSIKFQTAIAAKIEGEHGDYDKAKLAEYAHKGQEAGRQWALALMKHTDNRANWQYVHDSFAHVRASSSLPELAPPLLSSPPLLSLSSHSTPCLLSSPLPACSFMTT